METFKSWWERKSNEWIKKSAENEVLQIMKKTLISKKKGKQERENRQAKLRKERSNEMPFQGGENLIFQD